MGQMVSSQCPYSLRRTGLRDQEMGVRFNFQVRLHLKGCPGPRNSLPKYFRCWRGGRRGGRGDQCG